MPRHRGLGEECTTFFHKGARSNPVASFARRERNKREKLNEFGNENEKLYEKKNNYLYSLKILALARI